MRRAARADEQPRADQLREALRQPASERGDHADHRDPARQHQLARIDIDQARERNAHEHEGDHAGRAKQEAQRGVGQAEAALHLLGQHREHGGIEKG